MKLTSAAYLEGIGAEFGRNINAWTGLENTCYMLNNIPMKSEGVIDTCLLILHDWSCAIENLDSEINNERQVIIEERRTTNTAQRRMVFQRYKGIFGEDHKFANTSLIGSQENLENFDPQDLRDFYATWYRPDLQAIVVVGDIDVDQIENKIKERFSSLQMPENPQPKPVFEFAGNVEPRVKIITDPEATSTSVEVDFKHAPIPKEMRNTLMAFMNDLLIGLANNMFGAELELLDGRNKAFMENLYNVTVDAVETAFTQGVVNNISTTATHGEKTVEGEQVDDVYVTVTELAKAHGLAFVFEETQMLYIDPAQGVNLTAEARTALNIPEGRTLETLQQELMAKAQAGQAQ